MRAIITKYKGPTTFKGGRIIASSEKARFTLPYPHELNVRQAHRAAAVGLCKKMDWGNCDKLVGGGMDKGYAFVFVPSSCNCTGPLEGPKLKRKKKASRR